MPSRKKKPADQDLIPGQAPPAPAEPKPEAKAKAKADAKAKAEPKVKADAKAKASPKVQASEAPVAAPKAKPDAKAKADPKAKAKAEPKAKSQKWSELTGDAKAKAQPTASGKASAKSKAKEAPPPPPVEEEANDGLEVVKSRRRKKKKAEEIPPDQELIPDTTGAPNEQEIVDQKRIRDEHDRRNNALSQKFEQDLNNLPAISATQSRDKVMKEVTEQKKALENIMNEISDTLKTVKIAKPKNTNVGAIMQQMRDMKLAKTGHMFSETTIQYMEADFQQNLSQALAFDSYRCFQAEAQQIREKCEARIQANEASLKTVKSRDNQRQVLNKIADAKGVKAEDIDEKDVVSQSVDLPTEVTALQFLYKRKFEKQYGVVIDRPEGSKGAGKGSSSPPPKGLVVRGLKAEVASCLEALRGLNLKEQKAVTGVTPKQASTIMGSQQANARKLEEDFKGVFVHREAGTSPIMLYGPPKEVAACYKSIQDNLPEETTSPDREPREQRDRPSVNVMQIDKDLAKCLIGANGVTISKFETDTSTTIKVSNHQGKDEETQATVRINGEKANQEKARSQITAFLATLSSILVEAEPETVSRLYDSAVPRKGKGKSKGSGKGDGEKGSGKGNSKFAELWNTSGLTCLKKAKGVQLVGAKADVTKWKAVLEESLKEAGTVPFAVRLTNDQARLWSQERLDGIKDSCGAEKVQKVSRGRDTSIEVSGTDDQKEKAQKSIEEINQKLSSTETIEDVPESTKRYLTSQGKGNAQLREVEQKHDVCVSVGRKEQAVKITGAADSVVAAKTQLLQIISSVVSVTREIEIEWSQGRVVIGKNGSTVNSIRRDSGADSIKVEESEEQKKVVICGQKEAVDKACELIQEVLQKEEESVDKRKAGDGATKATNGGNAQDATSEKPAKAEAKAHPSKDKADATSESDKRPAEKKWANKAPKADFAVVEASFPSLGGDDAGKQGKPRPKNSAWNKGKEDDAAEPAAETATETDAAEKDVATEKDAATKESVEEEVTEECGAN